jgi:hypothetical protein
METIKQIPPERPLDDAVRQTIGQHLVTMVNGSARVRRHWSKAAVIGTGVGVLAVGGAAAAATSSGWLSPSGIPIAKPPPPRPEQLPPGTYDGRPLGVPTGPQTSVKDCPQDPSWSPPLPTGATVSVSLAPAGPEGVSVNGTFTSTAGYCVYTVTLPGELPKTIQTH